jgi:L-ribulose-5-phosphate 4-epimerase
MRLTMYEYLREPVYAANMALQGHGLVVFTWGNVSGIDRGRGVIAIKPSGVSYEDLTPENIVIVDLNGRVVEGNLRPSSDTPTHLELYRNFEGIGGVCHTHSRYATMWAQAEEGIPCFGTTHADYFYGPVPVTDRLTRAEIDEQYEQNTGMVIVRRFHNLDPLQMPAVLVANHGPFTWGKDAAEAVENAVVLEEVARMAYGTVALNWHQNAIPRALLDKHYLRKHGSNAYYGQGKKG